MSRDLAKAVERHQTEMSTRWARIQGGDVSEDDHLVIALTGLQVGFTNQIHRARLGPENVRARVRETTELIRGRRIPAWWFLGPLDTPAELPATLEEHGWHHEEDMPWMAADLGSLPRASLPPGVETHHVDGPVLQAHWLEAMTRGFGMDDQVRDAMTRLADAVGYGEDAGWQRFVALEHGRVVGSAGLMIGGGVVGIYNMATVEHARGRGIGGAMATLAMGWARDRGFDTAILGSAPLAKPLYERLGFQDVCSVAVYVLERSGGSGTDRT